MEITKEQQTKEMTKILLDSKTAISYESNAYPIDIYYSKTTAREKFYVSDNDGHLTIDYGVFANNLFDAGFRRSLEGEWIHNKSTPGGIHDTYRCSSCGYITGWTTNYCSKCGAKMKGDN